MTFDRLCDAGRFFIVDYPYDGKINESGNTNP